MKGQNLLLLRDIVNVPKFEIINFPYIPFESTFYAVRSNSKEEDGVQKNAGKFLTELCVSKENLEQSIERVIKNAGSAIIQEMIFPDLSGVVLDNMVYIAPGFCEGITSGRVNTDSFNLISGEKKNFNANQGLFFENNQMIFKESEYLFGEEKIKLLKDALNKIQKHFSKLDVEFSFCNEELFILQAREL